MLDVLKTKNTMFSAKKQTKITKAVVGGVREEFWW
jgi:hypothetical protein